MRKGFLYLFIALFNLLYYSAGAQEPAVRYGQKLRFYSTYLKDTAEVLVYLPDGYSSSGAKYPVIYLLDGNYYYTIATQAAKLLADVNNIPPAIIVGVSAKNRERDFTTPQLKEFAPPMPMPNAGGIENFISFLEKEVAVQIENKYRTAAYRSIIGHSLGGIVAMYSLYKTPNFYNSHVVVDASLWWNDGEVGKKAIAYLKANPNYKGKLVWIRDKIPHEVWFPINQQMLQYFTTARPAGLQFTFKELEDETHSTVIYPGIYLALKDMFKGFQFLFTAETTIPAFQRYYDSLSKEFGYLIAPSELTYNNLQHILTDVKGTGQGIEACKIWVANYPASAWANETLAELFLESGDKEHALVYVTKALQLDVGRESSKKLKLKIEK